MQLIRLTPLVLLSACMAGETPPPEPVQVSLEPEPIVTEEVAPPPPPPDPARLDGLNPAEVQGLLGEPTLVRRDNNVQIMLFENGDCVFEVIFYEPTTEDHFHARAMNARSRSGLDVDLGECLMKVLPDGKWLDQP